MTGKLVVISRVPGTGESPIAWAIVEKLGIPVCAKDRLEAVLVRKSRQFATGLFAESGTLSESALAPVIVASTRPAPWAVER